MVLGKKAVGLWQSIGSLEMTLKAFPVSPAEQTGDMSSNVLHIAGNACMGSCAPQTIKNQLR